MSGESQDVLVFDIQELSLPRGCPDDGITVAALALAAVHTEMLNGGLRCMVIVTVAGVIVRVHRLKGLQSALANHVLRFVAARTKADAVAVVYTVPVPPGVEADRACLICGESPSARTDVLLVVRDETRPDAPRTDQFITRHADGSAHRWLGVPPDPLLTMTLDDVVTWANVQGEA